MTRPSWPGRSLAAAALAVAGPAAAGLAVLLAAAGAAGAVVAVVGAAAVLVARKDQLYVDPVPWAGLGL